MSGYPVWLNRLALPELSPEVAALDVASRALSDAAGIGDFILRQRESIRRQGLTGTTAAARYSDVVDVALRRMLALAREEHGGYSGNEDSTGLAILSTGGYGRRELAPFSDIDVTFVPAREDDPPTDELVRILFRIMMEALQRKALLKVGYAYRVPSDCGNLDVQTQTSLIDSRFVAGDYGLFCDFKDELKRQISPARFVFDKNWDRAVARQSNGETLYRNEPDIKNGPGGLREIHTATWMAEVRFGVWSSAVWEELIDRDVVSFRQVERLFEALEFVHTLRNALHWRAGKQNDQLLVAQQGPVAEVLGFKETGEQTGSQQLMAAYFTSAEQICSVSRRVVNWILDSRLELGMGLACSRRMIECRSPEVFLSRPSHILHAFLLGQSLGIPLSADLEGTIRGAVDGDRAIQPDMECGPLLLQLLESPDRVWQTLHSMAHLGVLGWVLPEFAPLMTLAPRNSAHEFSVGYHSLEVVRRIEAMKGDPSDTVSLEVMSHIDYAAILYLAALLHDAGKIGLGVDHSIGGAAMIPAVGIRLELPTHRLKRLQFLIENHLLMSEVSHFRDLTRGDSIREVARVVQDQDALDPLFLITLADGLSVGNNVWSPIQTRFLEELYHRTSQMLARPHADAGDIDLRRYQRKVTMALSDHNLSPEDIARHIELMPASYLLNTPSETMALHIEMIRKVQRHGKPDVEFRDDRVSKFTELIVCTVDDPKPGLLRKIAGCLWAADLFVHAAQVYTGEGAQPLAIDSLWVEFHGRMLDPYQKRRLENDLKSVLIGAVDVKELLISRGKSEDLKAPLHELEVSVQRPTEHLICDVQAGDHRGLLYKITRAFTELGWHIESARINSGRNRVRDVFYVTEAQGLPADVAQPLLRDTLLCPNEDL